MNNVRPNVITYVQHPADLDNDAGLLPDFPHQRLGEGLAILDLPAGKAPGAIAIGVLVQQQNPVVLDDDPGYADMHPATVASRWSATMR